MKYKIEDPEIDLQKHAELILDEEIKNEENVVFSINYFETIEFISENI